MIKINLLPYREKEKKENIARQITIIGGSFVVFILLLIFVQFNLSSSIKSLEGQVKESEIKLVDLNKKIGDLDKFKKDKKELLERQIMYFKSPYEYSVILNIKFYDWKIKKIIIQDLIDDGENIDYKLNSLERSAPNLGYYFKGYNIP